MTLSLLVCYVVCLLFRPRLAACVALATFAWLGWLEFMRGSVSGVISAGVCGVIYAAAPLAAHEPSPARTGRA